MCRKMILCFAGFVLICGANPVAAQINNYFNGTVDDSFLNPGNWSDGSPQANNDFIRLGHTVNLNSPYEPPNWYVVNQLHLGLAGLGTNYVNTLNMNEGTLGVADYFAIGALWDNLGDGILNMYDGWINTTSSVERFDGGNWTPVSGTGGNFTVQPGNLYHLIK